MNRHRFLRTALLFVVIAGIGCGGARSAGTPLGARSARAQAAPDNWSPDLERPGPSALPPTGLGTLNQDMITVFLQTDKLQIKIVPLAEWVIRMLSPDTYKRLNGYKVARAADILEKARMAGENHWPHVMFVTLFTREIEESYQPYDLQIRSQNRVYRPLGIIHITPDYGRGRIYQEQPQIALYLYSYDIDLDLPMTVQYQTSASSRWNGLRNRIDGERARVESRAGAYREDATAANGEEPD